VAKANYKFDKRQRDLTRQKKQEEKRLKKLAKRTAAEPVEGSPPIPRDETP
jgi:hypothetical protein